MERGRLWCCPWADNQVMCITRGLSPRESADHGCAITLCLEHQEALRSRWECPRPWLCGDTMGPHPVPSVSNALFFILHNSKYNLAQDSPGHSHTLPLGSVRYSSAGPGKKGSKTQKGHSAQRQLSASSPEAGDSTPEAGTADIVHSAVYSERSETDVAGDLDPRVWKCLHLWGAVPRWTCPWMNSWLN